jgi:glutamyl-tRNA synthetase
MIRTRFAPSPTGFLHVGGLRTALYAYLFAKKHGGKFLLRIEDTDKTREVVGGTQNIINTLHWADLFFDEGPGVEGPLGPYIQSQRLELYQKHAQELIAAGHAYYCFCSAERLDAVRQAQIASKLPPAYDRLCRKLTTEEVQAKLATSEKQVIRMKVPLTGSITFNDIVRNEVSIGYSVVDDQVIIKSDGFPTYHLAVVVDDHYMQISHVIRGEEWLPSTPKHLLLYQYFGWQAPLFAHLPLLLNPDRSKLSKRQGDVAVEDYRAKGYLKEALINFVAFLGWNPGGTRELFSLQELEQEFSLERVGSAGAVFNVEKLNWINHQHIMLKSDEEVLAMVKPLMQQAGWQIPDDAYSLRVMKVLKERLVVLPDFITYGDYFFKAPTSFDETAVTKNWHHYTPEHIALFVERVKALSTFDVPSLEAALKATLEQTGAKMGALMAPLRITLTGFAQGVSVYELMEILGKEESLKRIAYGVKTLSKQAK